MTTSQHSWFIEPYYSVIYNDGKLTIFSSSPRKRGLPMTPTLDNKGYLRVSLSAKSNHIHRIVTQHFLGTRPDKFTVNHKDGNKLNNRIENLEYISMADNVRHAFSTGLNNAFCGVNSKFYKDGRTKDKAAYEKAYRLANKDKINANARASYLAKKNKTTTVTTNE